MNDYGDLRAACQSKDIDALWIALAQVSKREGAPFLADALLGDWHESHEDIVFELGLIGDPRTVQSIAQAAVTPFAYLIRWENLHEFQRKCAYALARIGSAESRAALKAFAKHPDPFIREYGEEGLQHWPLPYREGEYA
jgi:HEAT repeat protein